MATTRCLTLCALLVVACLLGGVGAVPPPRLEQRHAAQGHAGSATTGGSGGGSSATTGGSALSAMAARSVNMFLPYLASAWCIPQTFQMASFILLCSLLDR